MKQLPAYKSIKVSFETWQTLTRISARTGEPRTQIMERLARAEEQELKGAEEVRTAPNSLGDKGAIGKK